MSARPAETRMLRESREAPDAVARLIAANEAACRALGERLHATPPPFAITCARGSSDNAATYAKYLFEIRLGLVTASMGPSVRSVYAAAPRMRGALFLAISQSGQSPDLVELAEAARAGGAVTVALVNNTTSPLAARCETVLPLHAGAETSVAATKSFIVTLAAVLQLAAHWSGDRELIAAIKRLPDDLGAALRLDWSAAVPLLAAASSLYVVGRGIGFGLAQEAALKLKETSGLHAEALSAAELMHGPLALAGPDFPAFVFGQADAAERGIADLVRGLHQRRVPVVVAGLAVPGVAVLPSVGGIHPQAAPIALAQSFYPLAEAVARARGRDPDHPPHLRKVTETT